MRHIGTSLELPEVTTEDVIIRYGYSSEETFISLFNRSTVERNKARFLMDRSSVNGEYDDYLGQVVYLNRGGIPTLADGSPAETVNVLRRLQ